MGRARELTEVPLPPDRAFDLWTDLRRWPAFVDGFGHVSRADETWPEEGARVVWSSRPGGRGTVTERVLSSRHGEELSTEVLDDRMSGAQTVRLTPREDGGTDVSLELDYTLGAGGPLRGAVDLLFVRRALTDSLRRTLRRFATEAAEEAGLD
ncbi:MAG: SRPBCC family protein [Actinobacteria bacterium]|nr:SRPBCC family protein [Actinomycetota bacterium]